MAKILKKLLGRYQINEAIKRASDPATPPDKLEQLLSLNNNKVGAAVLENPNTSAHVLGKWGWKYPGSLLKNPVLVLLELENPNYLQNFSSSTVRGLLSLRDAPEELLLLALRSNIPVWWKLTVAGRAVLTDRLWEVLSSMNESSIRSAVVQNRHVPKNILEKLVNDNDLEILKTFIRSPHVSQLYVEKIIERAENNPSLSGILTELAGSTGVTEDQLDVLWEHSESSVRRGVSRNIKVSLSQLKRLVFDRDPKVRKAIAEVLIDRVLEIMPRNVSSELWAERKKYFLKNFPEMLTLLNRLARDPSTSVRARIAQRITEVYYQARDKTHLVEFILLDLSDDVDQGVQKTAKTGLKRVQTYQKR